MQCVSNSRINKKPANNVFIHNGGTALERSIINYCGAYIEFPCASPSTRYTIGIALMRFCMYSSCYNALCLIQCISCLQIAGEKKWKDKNYKSIIIENGNLTVRQFVELHPAIHVEAVLAIIIIIIFFFCSPVSLTASANRKLLKIYRVLSSSFNIKTF